MVWTLKIEQLWNTIVGLFSFAMTHPPLNWSFVHFWWWGGGVDPPLIFILGTKCWHRMFESNMERGQGEFGGAYPGGGQREFRGTPKGLPLPPRVASKLPCPHPQGFPQTSPIVTPQVRAKMDDRHGYRSMWVQGCCNPHPPQKCTKLQLRTGWVIMKLKKHTIIISDVYSFFLGGVQTTCSWQT